MIRNVVVGIVREGVPDAQVEAALQALRDLEIDGRGLKVTIVYGSWHDRITDGLLDVYAPRLLAGRLFDPAHSTDDSTGRKGLPKAIVINRQAVTKLGFRSPQDAIGKTVGGDRPRTIIGVIDEMRFFSPRLPTDPTYYLFYRNGDLNAPVVSIRFAGDPYAMMDQIRATWRHIAPQVPLNVSSGDQALAEYYKADEQTTRMFGIGAGLAVLIGCVGLWGLASFNTARRVKEIGIRKTLGASSADIVKLLVGQFLRPVLIANVVAWPLAFVAMRTWLAGFDDRIALSPLFFLGASVLATAIAVLTVLGQSLRASRAAPAWALRHE